MNRPGRRPGLPDGVLSVRDVEYAAMKVLPSDVYDFVAGGSAEERIPPVNENSFGQWYVAPRVTTDLQAPDTSATLLGAPVSMPVAIAPMTYQGALHPDAEPALASAARAAGIPYAAATLSSRPLEEIAAVGGQTWFQLHWLRDRGLTGDLIQRAESAGCQALMLTVDVPLISRRPRDLRNGFAQPQSVGDVNLHAYGEREHTYVPGRSALAEHTAAVIEPALDWSAVEWIRGRTGMALVLEGVQHPDDARHAAELGVDGVVVCNHGGRQLDGAVPSIVALPAVAEAVADAAGERCQVLLGGGVRGGTDVLKALTLGASGVLLGRPALWGLALGGRDGAEQVLSLLRNEIEQALALSGCADVASARRLRVVRGDTAPVQEDPR
jgi:4-hydroxymandelate oxidase